MPESWDGLVTGRVYSPEEAEFLAAVEEFKRETGRKFPALTELLGVLKGLGYRKEKANDAG